MEFIFVLKEKGDADIKIEKLKSICNELEFSSGFNVIEADESENIEDVVFEHVTSQYSDLLVLLAHQRNFWEGVFHKSISKGMVKHAILPIMVLPDIKYL